MVPQVTRTVKRATEKIIKKDVLVVGAGIKTGLDIQVDNPAQLGGDLLVDSVAAMAEHEAPLIVIDMWTATTVCVINEKKQYLGGMILPGVRISLDTLTSRTSQLPRISLDPPKKVIGTNTIDCMKSGVLLGNAACMDGMIQRIEKELGEKATVLATGGIARVIVPNCLEEIILDDKLLLKGLWLIYKKNQQ